jgi:hypothetical protein
VPRTAATPSRAACRLYAVVEGNWSGPLAAGAARRGGDEAVPRVGAPPARVW